MRFYNWWFPLGFAFLFTLATLLFPGDIVMSGDGGFFSGVIGAISLLPGFYIASLAAVATFGADHMDEIMPSPTPSVIIRTAQTSGPEPLSRRMFLSYLFGYLAISSLLLVAVSFILDMTTPGVANFIETQFTTSAGRIIEILQLVVLFFFTFVLGSILVTTLHGTYYLMERIFQPT
jgi:hypothetical protein